MLQLAGGPNPVKREQSVVRATWGSSYDDNLPYAVKPDRTLFRIGGQFGGNPGASQAVGTIYGYLNTLGTAIHWVSDDAASARSVKMEVTEFTNPFKGLLHVVAPSTAWAIGGANVDVLVTPPNGLSVLNAAVFPTAFPLNDLGNFFDWGISPLDATHLRFTGNSTGFIQTRTLSALLVW